MPKENTKFLVNLLHDLSHRQVFFFIWAGIVGGFILAMMSYYKRATRRNFRSPLDGPGPKVRVDLRKLPESGKSSQVVPKNNSPSSKR